MLRRGLEASSRGLSLTIRGLRKSFGDNEVLRGIDLHIPAGQSVAIVGRSGWVARVIEEATVKPGDRIEVIPIRTEASNA